MRATFCTFGFCFSILIGTGCQSAPKVSEPGSVESPTVDPRALNMFDGATGQRVTWQELMQRAAQADVALLGEQHTDAVGHDVQLAFTEDLLQAFPGSALSLEMLERDEQLLVDDFADGILNADQFAQLTFSTTWAGEGSWAAWYQPIIDATLAQQGPVIAANAPRRYVRLARTDSYERLDALPTDRRAFFSHPEETPQGSYRDNFWETMRSVHPGPQNDESEGDAGDGELDEETQQKFESLFRSQLVWDATMAQSIANALDDGAPKVIHLVGRFHIDFEGGTVQQLREQRKDTALMTVSMAASGATELQEEDFGRADIVIYTADEGSL